MKRKIFLFPALAATCGIPFTVMVACNPSDPESKPEQIFISKSNFQYFEQTDTLKLDAYVYPYGSVNEFVWESTDPENFPVTQDGNVSWSGNGYYAYIYVHPKGYDNLKAACRVNACFDFEKCDWSTIVFHANALENGEIDDQQFCNSFYFVDQDSQNDKKMPQNLNEFVGHTKKLSVNHVNHEVIILGIRQDHQKHELDDRKIDRFSAPVTFTFQFNNVICDTDKAPLSFQWNSTSRDSTKYWKEGQIHDKLNNSNDGVLSMIDDPIVRNNIKTVKRRVNEYFEEEGVLGWHSQMGDEKIFMPVVFDIFDSELEPGETKPEYWKNYWQESVVGHLEWDDQGNAKFVPEPYSYYKNNIDLEVGRIGQQECLIRRDLWNNPCEYWLSSPYGVETEKYDLSSDYVDLINSVFGDGHSLFSKEEHEHEYEYDHLHTDEWLTIAPCFCI